MTAQAQAQADKSKCEAKAACTTAGAVHMLPHCKMCVAGFSVFSFLASFVFVGLLSMFGYQHATGERLAFH